MYCKCEIINKNKLFSKQNYFRRLFVSFRIIKHFPDSLLTHTYFYLNLFFKQVHTDFIDNDCVLLCNNEVAIKFEIQTFFEVLSLSAKLLKYCTKICIKTTHIATYDSTKSNSCFMLHLIKNSN